MYHILAHDGIDKDGLKLFEDSGMDVCLTGLNKEYLLEQVGNYDALLVRSKTKVTKEVIEAGVRDNGNLKIIGRAGVGYDNVDIKTASENGVLVKNAPHGSTNATAELAHALMLCCARKIPQAHYSLKNGKWKKKEFQGVEVSGKILGIIGCGRIGQRLSELVSGYGMEVIGYDVNLDLTKSRFPDSKIRYVSKEDILQRADFISIHTGGKEIIISDKEISSVKRSLILINASRGGNLDEEALYRALKNRYVLGAGLDSYVNEPRNEGEEVTEAMKKLGDLENVVLSSHLGASTNEAQRKTSVEMARVTIDYLLDGDFTNAVNVRESLEQEEKPIYSLFIYHQDAPGIFAPIDGILRDNNINIREPASRGLGEDKALTIYLLHQPPTPEIIEKIRNIPEVYRVGV